MACDVQLAVGEAHIGEVDADAREGLPLRLVDGHRERDAHGELPPAPLERERAFLRVEGDARDVDDVAAVCARTRDLGLEQVTRV